MLFRIVCGRYSKNYYKVYGTRRSLHTGVTDISVQTLKARGDRLAEVVEVGAVVVAGLRCSNRGATRAQPAGELLVAL